MPSSISEPSAERIRLKAEALGFDACGFASVDSPWPAGARLAEFIAEGRHGSMDWMETTAERQARLA